MIKGTEIESVWIDEFTDTRWDRCYNWCFENMGPATDYPPRWQPGDLGDPLRFKFRDPRDELWFKLRWGL